MIPTKDTDEDEWMNVQVEASESRGTVVAQTLEAIAEVADDAPVWARYDFEVVVVEYDTRVDEKQTDSEEDPAR